MVDHARHAVCTHLDTAGVAYTLVEHKAVYTSPEADALGLDHLGTVPKNLFLRNAKGTRYYLVTLNMEGHVDLAALGRQLDCGKLSFASEERLQRVLHIERGAVSPLALLLCDAPEVELIMDCTLVGLPSIGVHPCDNRATLFLSYSDLIRMIEQKGYPVRTVEL